MTARDPRLPWLSFWPTSDHGDCRKDARHIGVVMDAYLITPDGVSKIAPMTFCPDCYEAAREKRSGINPNAEEAP